MAYVVPITNCVTNLINSLTRVYQMAINFECILPVILMSWIIDLPFDLLINLLPITFQTECIDDDVLLVILFS